MVKSIFLTSFSHKRNKSFFFKLNDTFHHFFFSKNEQISEIIILYYLELPINNFKLENYSLKLKNYDINRKYLIKVKITVYKWI